MAAGGVTQSRRQFYLPVSNISLTVTEGNIIDTSAEALATGEDKDLTGHGGVSQLLLKTCPKAYKSARDQLKKNTKKFEFGNIYPCHVPSSVAGRKPLSFNVVLHAIVPSAKIMTNQKEWTDVMKVLYYNLFKAANNQGRASLALPLMGSGGAGASPDVAVDVLAHALTTFRMKQEARQHLRDIVLYVRKDIFGKMVAKVESKLKELPTPNGIVQHASAGSSRGAGNTRPPSSSSKKGKPASGKKTGRAAKNPGRTNPSSGGFTSASASAGGHEDEMSNMTLILQGVTLESVQKIPPSQPEEDMDCSDYEFVNMFDGSEDEDADEDDESADEEDGPGDDDDGNDENKEDHKCAICLDDFVEPKKLEKCGHIFCRECIEDSFKHHKPVCPSCNTAYGMITGNQPQGTMSMTRNPQSLPGYDNCGHIVIDYQFPSGIQGPEHPNPGQAYHGTSRRAFLPDSAEGRKVYRLLRVAFDNRLTFTIGRSVTTGYDNVVTWNDIHHKTKPYGGATGFGYPDPDYLGRVQEELAAKGVTEECLEGRTFDL